MHRYVFPLLIIVVTGCSSLDPVSISSNDMDIKEELVFEASLADVIAATKGSLETKNWKLLYEGKALPDKNYSYFSNISHNPFRSNEHNDRFDQIAIDKALRSDIPPSYYLQAKTPTSAFSYGAEIFVVAFEVTNQGTILSIAASSGQVLEKKKLNSYIEELSSLINEKTD